METVQNEQRIGPAVAGTAGACDLCLCMPRPATTCCLSTTTQFWGQSFNFESELFISDSFYSQNLLSLLLTSTQHCQEFDPFGPAPRPALGAAPGVGPPTHNDREVSGNLKVRSI